MQTPTLSLLLAVLLALVAPPAAAAPPDTLLTRAEATDFRATTRYADVITFMERVAEHPGIHLTTFGTSHEGRALPLAVIGAPGTDAAAVQATGKTRVLVFANIHAGEVAGKEAALILLREIAAGQHAVWADSLVLLVAPIYNADGNERIDPRNRPRQHGPVDGMGTRANAQGLDLNRDFEKLDAPETRALVSLIDGYDPHLVVDLHTTNGTVHAYHLTYAPPLHPNTPENLDHYVRSQWLPAVRQMVWERTGYETYYYGNDIPEWGLPRGWSTFDPRPRFGTNYVGLRNRFAILSEAYSYATFEERVLATHAFVAAILDYASEHAAEIAQQTAQADAQSVVGERLAARSAGTWEESPAPDIILLGEVVEEPNPHTGEPMWRRTDAQIPTEMPLYQRFSGSDSLLVPAAYLVPEALTEVTERLAIHGVRTYPLSAEAPFTAERFRIDSVQVADRTFQHRIERELFGRFEPVEVDPDAERFLVVPVDQPLGRLAFSLLEPQSDSGFAIWGVIPGEAWDLYPILRIHDRALADRLYTGP